MTKSDNPFSPLPISSETGDALATESGNNRSILSKIEQAEHVPSIAQLEALANIIDFDITELFTIKKEKAQKLDYVYNIAVAGTGYVGLSIATLLAQHNHVTAVDIIPEKLNLLIKKITYSR